MEPLSFPTSVIGIQWFENPDIQWMEVLWRTWRQLKHYGVVTLNQLDHFQIRMYARTVQPHNYSLIPISTMDTLNKTFFHP